MDWSNHLIKDFDNSSMSNSSINCNVKCPNVYLDPSAWPLWILAFFYCLLAVIGLLILRQTLNQNLEKSSFRNNFLIMQTLFCAMRLTFLVVNLPWRTLYLFMFYLCVPMLIEFVTFSLLVVFLLRCLLIMQGRVYLVTKYLYPGYGIVVSLLAGGVVGVSFLGMNTSSNQTEGYDKSTAFFSSTVFGILTLCGCGVGIKTHTTLMKIIKSEALRAKVVGLSFIISFYSFVFLGRTLWSVTYSFDVNIMQTYLNGLQSDSDLTNYYISFLVFYFIFEIIPTTFILHFLYNWIPREKIDHVINDDTNPANFRIPTPLRNPTTRDPLLPRGVISPSKTTP